MKELKRFVEERSGSMCAFDVYLEHNGHKFQIHYESTDSAPCATRGHDWYSALNIMKEDGTFSQITDAAVVGAPTHYDMKRCERRGESFASKMEEAIAKFKEFIETIY